MSPSTGQSVLSSRARFERRASTARRRPVRLIGGVVVLVVVALVAVWAVGFSPVFVARTVTVTGLTDPGERSAVTKAAQIAVGTPLARVDTGGASSRVEAIAIVKSVEVQRSWPSTIVVAVHRKVPVLAVKNPQGQLQVVDEDGVPFQTVTGLPAGIAQVNATTDAPDPDGLKAAISVLELLGPGQRATVSKVTVTSADLVTLQLGAVGVIWGGVADGPKKLKILNALLPTNPSVIDVSAPDTPVTR